nr:hypothetical protein [Ancylobacter defluvii]
MERIIRDANSAVDVVGRVRALFRQSTDARGTTSLASILSKTRELLADESLRRHTSGSRSMLKKGCRRSRSTAFKFSRC